MAIVKVWNDHDREHVEKFKNETIRIPAGGSIEMDYIDAMDFQGQFFGMKMLGPNNPDPKCFKKIRVEEPSEPVVKEDPNILHATGKSLGSAAEVIAMAKALALLNPELVAKDAELEKRGTLSDLERANEKLRAELAAMRAEKKPGPKPKLKAQA